MSRRILITGAVLANGTPTDILVSDGLVAELGTGLSDAEALAIDGAGLIALPGLVDLHTHLREPGFEQADNDPVVCVSAADALAYLDWVGQRDGRSYRLPAPTERPQNQAGLAEWTNACIASGDAAQPCPRRVAAGPLLQERQLDIDRGYDDVSFRWVAK